MNLDVFLLGLYIFFGRLADMTLNAFRVSLITKKKRVYAALVAVVEAIIWFLVVKKAMNTTVESLFIVLSYAFGFAMGTFLGTSLASILDRSKLCIRIITSDKDMTLIEELKKANIPLSFFSCEGAVKEHYMIYIVATKEQCKQIKEITDKYDSQAFTIINENKEAINGSFLRMGK